MVQCNYALCFYDINDINAMHSAINLSQVPSLVLSHTILQIDSVSGSDPLIDSIMRLD